MASNAAAVQKLRPRRPCLDENVQANNNNDVNVTNYLESVLYGEEKDSDLPLLLSHYYCYYYRETGDDDHQPDVVSPLWNVQFRLWLLHHKHINTREATPTSKTIHTTTTTTNQKGLPTWISLPSILAQLQSQVLLMVDDNHHDGSDSGQEEDHHDTTDLMDVVGASNNNNSNNMMTMDHQCWQQDPMLVFWKQHQRFHVVQDLHTIIWSTLLPSEQRCVMEIIQAIDQVTGYHDNNNTNSNTAGGDNDDDDDESSVLAALRKVQSFMDQKSMERSQEKKEEEPRISLAAKERDSLFSFGTFRDWIANEMLSKEVAERHESLGVLCRNVGKEGTRGQFFHDQFLPSVDKQEYHDDDDATNHSEASRRVCLSKQIPWLATVEEHDDETTIRGKALILYSLLSRGIGTAAQVVARSRQDGREQLYQQQLLLRKWHTVTLPRTDNAQSLQQAVEDYLLVQPQQRKFTPNLEALVIKLWENAFSSCTSAAESHTVLQVTKQMSLWLPFQPMVPLYRSKLRQLFSVTQDSEYSLRNSGIQTNNVATPNATNEPQNCRRLRDMTSLLLSCCNGHATYIRYCWRNIFDEAMICDTVLPLYFWHSLLLMADNINNPPSLSIPVMNSIQNLCCLLETLQSGDAGTFELFLEAVPAMTVLFYMFADLLRSSPKSHEAQQEDEFFSKTNCYFFRRLQHDHIQELSIAGEERGNILPLRTFFDALVTFCQLHGESLLPPSDEWCRHVFNQCQKLWKVGEGFCQTWIASLVNRLSCMQGGCFLSLITEKLHRLLIPQCSGQTESGTICLFGMLVAEVAKLEVNTTMRRDIVATILHCSRPEYVFGGCDEESIVALYAQGLSMCNEFAVPSETTQCILVAAALQLGKLRKDSDDIGHSYVSPGAWSKCKLRTLEFLMGNLHSGHLETLRKQVTNTLELLGTDEGLAWWQEVCGDVDSHCKGCDETADTSKSHGEALSNRKRLAPEDGYGSRKYPTVPGTDNLEGALRRRQLPSRRQGKSGNGAVSFSEQRVVSNNEELHLSAEENFSPPAVDSESPSDGEASGDGSDSDEILLLDLN